MITRAVLVSCNAGSSLGDRTMLPGYGEACNPAKTDRPHRAKRSQRFPALPHPSLSTPEQEWHPGCFPHGRPVFPPSGGADVKTKVLILDDHPTYQQLLRSAAQSRGFKVLGIEASSGAALETCAKTRPSVIVMDLHLDEDSNGYSFCKLLREINGPVKIVVISSFSGRDSIDRAFAAGADRCLRKPFRMEEALRLFEHLALELDPVTA
ncbi:hypothetical protein DRQ32_03125 [bacterium]|nr:MAG: hypothetical protein DRQ32_03125 [bacterium]